MIIKRVKPKIEELRKLTLSEEAQPKVKEVVVKRKTTGCSDCSRSKKGK